MANKAVKSTDLIELFKRAQLINTNTKYNKLNTTNKTIVDSINELKEAMVDKNSLGELAKLNKVTFSDLDQVLQQYLQDGVTGGGGQVTLPSWVTESKPVYSADEITGLSTAIQEQVIEHSLGLLHYVGAVTLAQLKTLTPEEGGTYQVIDGGQLTDTIEVSPNGLVVYSNGQWRDFKGDFKVDLGITCTTTKEVGGIPKGTVITDKNIKQVLVDLLSPYVAPTVSAPGTVNFIFGKTSVVTYTVSVAQGSVPVASIKENDNTVPLTNNAYSKSINITPSTTNFSNSYVINDGTGVPINKTVNITGVGGVYMFYSESTTAPTILDMDAHNCQSLRLTPDGTYTVNNPYENGGYLHIMIPATMSITAIKSNGLDVPYVKGAAKNCAVSSAITMSYVDYCSAVKHQMGSIKFSINPK